MKLLFRSAQPWRGAAATVVGMCLVLLSVVWLVSGAAHTTTAPSAAATYLVPLGNGGQLLRGFDPPEQRWLAGHRGVDFHAAVGQEVLSPAAGEITFAGWVVDRPVLTITHDDGFRSSFEPVSSALVAGTEVQAGEVVGVLTVDRRHCHEPCLHWGLRQPQPSEQYLNPLRLLPGGGPIVLLPVLDY